MKKWNVYIDQVCYLVCLHFLIGQVMGVVVLILIINNGGISGGNCGLSLRRLFCLEESSDAVRNNEDDDES